MQKQLLLTASAAVLAFSASALADVEIRITGASAFRQATLRTIKAQFDSVGAVGDTYTFAHDKNPGGTNYDGSTRSVWKGSFPGVSGTTTIRCTFTGSVEGIRAVAQGGSYNATYLTDAAMTSITGETGNTSNSPVAMTAKFAFSDVFQSSTPVTNPVLSPGDPRVGVVTFTMLANKGSSENLTNVTSQQARALVTRGFQPLSLFTGNPNDANDYVIAIGRNDGSGTRTTYLAEIGYGITNAVNQYISRVSNSTAIQEIQLTPANSVYSSTVWGYDMDGNGGYESGGNVRTDFAKTTDSVMIRDAAGEEVGSGIPVHLVTWLSTGDARTAIASGARELAYNGVKIDPRNAPLSAADQEKVTNGQYTAWGYENLYYSGTLSVDEGTVYNAIKAGIPTHISTSGAGIPMEAMLVGRSDDGGLVAP